MRRSLLAIVAAALLATGGCAGGAATPADPLDPLNPATPPSSDGHASAWDVTAMPDPCRTVTRADVAPVIGAPIEAGTRLESWPPLCSFLMPGPPQEFLYVSDDSRPAAKEDFARQRTDSAKPESVTGLGDQAYWLPDFTALHVLRGPTHLTVKFAGGKPPDDAKTKATAIARLALPRATAEPRAAEPSST